MVNGTPEISLSLSLLLPLFLCRKLCYLPFEYLVVFGSLARVSASLRARPQPIPSQPELCSAAKIARNTVVPCTFSLHPSQSRPRTYPARIPINKKNTPGRPQNGSSFTRSPSSWHLRGGGLFRARRYFVAHATRSSLVCVRACARANRLARRLCAALALSLFSLSRLYNKLATRARIIPSYWK